MKSFPNQERSIELDLLKGIAIISIVLYHFAGSVLPFGYLGVEIFFVISGYLLMKSILRSVNNAEFSFFRQISHRVLRLLPAVLAMSVLSFIVGYILMLPDDFENLAQSIIASTFFSNNILAAITTKNYWDVVNLFKPFMHTWYLGVLVQGYVIIVGIVALCKKIIRNKPVVLKLLFSLVTVISLVLYLTPSFSQAWKFYFIPFRLFEITAGSLIALSTSSKKPTPNPILVTIIKALCIIVIVTNIVLRSDILPASIKLLMTVALTSIYTYMAAISPLPSINVLKPLAFLGRNSFPIYITHQCIVAFFYYALIYETTVSAFLAFVVAVTLFSLIVHFGIEKPVNKFLKLKKQKTLWIVCCLAALLICSASGLVYLNAGVVRDVPELDISVKNAHRGMHASYCDVPYAWDNDFSDSDNVKVLVVGDSFGRDFANILNESEIANHIEISYIFGGDANFHDKVLRRSQSADIVFCSTSSLQDISTFLQESIPQEKLWVVGYKNFGNSNGYIYKQRFSSDYFSQTQTISEAALIFNTQMKEKYNTHYIDMIAAVLQGDNQVRVFSDDCRFISQDCRHLTQAGAQFYAKELDLSWILTLTN